MVEQQGWLEFQCISVYLALLCNTHAVLLSPVGHYNVPLMFWCGPLLDFYRPQTKFAKVMFLQVSVCPQGEACVVAGGHAWLWGACMVVGGHVWLPGACVVAGGHVWLQGGVHGCRGVCMVAGGVHGCRGACVVVGGACVVAGGHVWLQGGMCGCGGVVVGGCVWHTMRYGQ